jgi:hypothetical protein
MMVLFWYGRLKIAQIFRYCRLDYRVRNLICQTERKVMSICVRQRMLVDPIQVQVLMIKYAALMRGSLGPEELKLGSLFPLTE